MSKMTNGSLRYPWRQKCWSILHCIGFSLLQVLGTSPSLLPKVGAYAYVNGPMAWHKAIGRLSWLRNAARVTNVCRRRWEGKIDALKRTVRPHLAAVDTDRIRAASCSVNADVCCVHRREAIASKLWTIGRRSRSISCEGGYATQFADQRINPLKPTSCCHMVTAIKHPVPDRVKPSFVIFDSWALWRSGLSVRVPGCQKFKWRLDPVWQRMLYSCTHMATVGFKGF